MKFAVLFLFLFFNVFANKKESYLIKNFLNPTEFNLFLSQIPSIKNPNFDLQNSLNKLKLDEFKIALKIIFLEEVGDLKKFNFNDLSSLYSFYSQHDKKQQILSYIQNYVINFEVSNKEFDIKFQEIEEIIWFFAIIENNNLINYLNNNKITVQQFLENIQKSKNFNFVKELIYPLSLRASLLLWDGKITNAISLINKIPPSRVRDLLIARLYFKTQNPQYKEVAKKVISTDKFNDEGLVYDYINFLSKTEHYMDFLPLIGKLDINFDAVRSDKLWHLIQNLIYEYISKRKYVDAYKLVSKLSIADSKNSSIFNRAQFLSGLISFKFLNEPNIAIYHFNKIYQSQYSNVHDKARSSYFIAQSYKKLYKNNSKQIWLKNASKLINTFYGILAIEELNKIEPVLFFGLENYSIKKFDDNVKKRNIIHKAYFDFLINSHYKTFNSFNNNAFENNVPFKVGIIMLYLDRPEGATFCFEASQESFSALNVKQMFDLINDFLTQNNIKTKRRILNTFAQNASNKGVLIVEDYPFIDFVLNTKSIDNKALIHGIIKQESNFKVQAISSAGALGLMQVLPSTGRLVVSSYSLDFSISKLKNDYQYNIRVGSFYLDKLLLRFQNSFSYSIISYNAGPARIRQWKNKYFEVSTLDDMLAFMELIPFNETRNYIFKVFQNEIIYNYLINNHSQKSILPISKVYYSNK